MRLIFSAESWIKLRRLRRSSAATIHMLWSCALFLKNSLMPVGFGWWGGTVYCSSTQKPFTVTVINLTHCSIWKMCVGESLPDCMCPRDFSLWVLKCRFESTSEYFPALPEASPADFLPSHTAEYNSFISWHDFISLLSPHYGILSSQADYFSCVATLLYSRKDTCLYRACPTLDCNKKVLDQHNGWYRCEKCNREFPNFKYRLLLSVSPQNV